MTLTAPNNKIVDEKGNMNAVMRNWAAQVTQLAPIIGTGSPEGVIVAEQGRFYIDDSGLAGSVLYVKRDGDIGKDRSQGWILV